MRALAFEHGNLLSKGKDFKGRVASALAEDANDRDHGQKCPGVGGWASPAPRVIRNTGKIQTTK
jgi:hypothetical protein